MINQGSDLERLSDNCHCEEQSDEAVSHFPNKIEIAALPRHCGVARNDRVRIVGQPLEA